jgi:hypothetical protein
MSIGNYSTSEVSQLKFTSAMVSGVNVTFMAFLKSFSQNFTSEWSTETVYGRNDPIAMFRGTTRNLSLGWTVPAGNLEDSKSNLEKFEKLTQMVYPNYGAEDKKNNSSTNALVITKTPLIRLKFANLINDSAGSQADGLLGYITSLSWNPALDMGMFTDGTTKLYPKVFDLDIQFGVLHEHDLGFVNGNFRTKKFPFGG